MPAKQPTAYQLALAQGRKDAAEDLMNKLRQAGCTDDGWNGYTVVEVVDAWLAGQGVDTHAWYCETCDEVIAGSTDAEIADHNATEHFDDEEEEQS